MIKPKRLNKGSKIAVISPSWGGPSIYSDIDEKGLNNLKDFFGFEIIEYPTARMDANEIYDNPHLRAKDINDAFINKEIEGIIASIGGYESIRILKYLDIEKILSNPKIIMGYSDSTTFLSYLNYKGLVTFHGPTIMAGWAQIHNFSFVIKYYRKMLMTNNANIEIKPFPAWSESYPDWRVKANIGKINNFQSNDEEYIWIQGSKTVKGKLWGGCIEVIDFLKGTDYWPDNVFWKDRILIIETSEEKPSPKKVGYSIRNLGIQGILNSISGILIGRARDYDQEEKNELYITIKSIVAEEFNNPELLIVGNLDFGHTDPNLVLPLGIDVELNPKNRTIFIKEKIYCN